MPRIIRCKVPYTPLNKRGVLAREGEPIVACVTTDPTGEMTMLADSVRVVFGDEFYNRNRWWKVRWWKVRKVCITWGWISVAAYVAARAWLAVDAVFGLTSSMGGN